MKFPKDQNTLTNNLKNVNSLMKFPKDRNTLTTVSNLKNVTSLMFYYYQITQGILRVDLQSVSGNRMEWPTDLIVGLSLHTHGISHELVVGSMKMQPFQMIPTSKLATIKAYDEKCEQSDEISQRPKYTYDLSNLKNVNSLMKFPKDHTLTKKSLV